MNVFMKYLMISKIKKRNIKWIKTYVTYEIEIATFFKVSIHFNTYVFDIIWYTKLKFVD